MSAIYGPRVSPTLDLNFARNKSLVDTMTGRNLIDFSRVQSGTSKSSYFGADGVLKYADSNEPRFDHDPTTGESLGLLVEESRTNVIKLSEYLGLTSPWLAYNLTVQRNAALSPNRTFTASSLTLDSSNTAHRITVIAGTTSATPTNAPYIFSGYFKYNGHRYVGFYCNINAGIYGHYDLVDGVAAVGSIEYVGNGWYKCISSQYPAASNNANNTLSITLTSSVVAYSQTGPAIQGDGISGILAWGIQSEAGSFPTSYIPTPATFVSRTDSTQGASYYDANGIIQYTALGAARDNAYFPDENGVMRPAGLLLEAAGTNLYTRSQAPISADVLNTSITLNSASAPDNTSTAIILEPTGINDHGWAPYFTGLTASTNYTLSLFVKAKELSRVSLSTAGTAGMVFDASTGQIISGSGTVQKLPDSWYRCSYTFPSTASGIWDTRVYILDNSGNFSYTANGTDGIYFWGFQFELGSYPTSYIPTDGTPGGITRAADVSSSSTIQRTADVVQITGTNFSSWYNNNEGTFFTDAILAFTNNAGNPFTFGGVYYTAVANFSGDLRTLANGGIMGGLPISLTSFSKTAVALKSGNFALGVSGSIINTSSLAYTPTGTQFRINSSLGSKALIKRLTYWPERLPDTTLQRLTS